MLPHSPDPIIILRNSRLLWCGVVVLLLAAAFGIVASGLSIDFTSNPTLLAAGACYTGVAWFYSCIRPDERLARALTTVAQLFLILLFGLLLSYAATAIAMPYRDAE